MPYTTTSMVASTKRRESQKLRTCVYNSESPSRTGVSGRPIGLNKRHEDSLISFLQEHYGWHLGDDGNLYAPYPQQRGYVA